MAEPMKFKPIDYAIGVGVVLVCFVVVYLIAGVANLAVPQWLLSGIAAAIGVAIWFNVMRRRNRS